MTTHRVQILHEYFEPLVQGDKKFEVRLNDRNYRCGDTLVLEEVAIVFTEDDPGGSLIPTGKTFTTKVGFVLYGGCFGIAEGWCVMSLYGGYLTLPQRKGE